MLLPENNQSIGTANLLYCTVAVLVLKCCPLICGHQYSQSVQRLPQAYTELTGISVSLSDWLDYYTLCDLMFTYLTLTQHYAICPTERCLIQ